MPVLQFKGKTAVENYHYVVPHHTVEFDRNSPCWARAKSRAWTAI
jgi:hypothetical protein